MSGTIALGDGVAVVGAGIGGLAAALSLDAIGVDVTVFEAASEVRPAGVGINLLPHSIRELDALGLLDRLAEERAPDGFDHIDDVISPHEILEITDGYRRTAGFALAALADPTSLADVDYEAG